MSKLAYLADGQKVTIATDNEPFILRDICRNDSASRIICIINADPSDPDGSGIANPGDMNQLGANNAVHLSHTVDAQAAGVEQLALTVTKVGGGFQVSLPAVASLDTPAKFAAMGFQDPKRTTYPNLFELAKQVVQNAELQAAIISGMSTSTTLLAFIIDQNNETVLVRGNSDITDCDVTHAAMIELDDFGSTQFGE